MKRNSLLYLILTATVLFLTGCRDDEEKNCGATSGYAAGYLLPESATGTMISPDVYYDCLYDVEGGIMNHMVVVNQSESALSFLNIFGNFLRSNIQNFVSENSVKLDKVFQRELNMSSTDERQWQIESWSFNYRSKSARGEDVILSGRVTFPNNMVNGVNHELKSLMLFMHHAMPSASFMPSDLIDMWTLRAFFNEAVIQPDGQGLGANLDKDYYCTAAPDVLARQLADCTKAALELMRNRGVTLADDGYSICSSLSLGAAVPLMYAKYYETEADSLYKKATRLKAVYSGCGPMDMAGTIRYVNEHPQFSAILCKNIIFSLAALSPQQLGGYQSEDFVNNTFLIKQVEYNGRMLPYYEAEARYYVNIFGTTDDMPNPTRLSEILSSDMLTQNGMLNMNKHKAKVLMQVLSDHNNLSGWQPTIPIFLMHCKQDDGIPYEQALNCYQTLSNSGKNPQVHFEELSYPVILPALTGFSDLSIIHIISTVEFMNAYMNEDMSSAQDKWK